MELSIPGEYLKKEDFEKGEEKVLTVTGCKMEEIGPEKDDRPCLSFKETDQKLVLNKTNIALIYAAHETTESEDLKGKKITLYVDKSVSFQGKIVGGIRVRAEDPDNEPPF